MIMIFLKMWNSAVITFVRVVYESSILNFVIKCLIIKMHFVVSQWNSRVQNCRKFNSHFSYKYTNTKVTHTCSLLLFVFVVNCSWAVTWACPFDCVSHDIIINFIVSSTMSNNTVSVLLAGRKAILTVDNNVSELAKP